MEHETLNREYYRQDEHNCINYHICFSSARGIINFLYDQLREFTILFKKYLLDEVLMHLEEKSKFQLSLRSIGIKEGSKDVYVLSFNYTDTCKRLYEKKFNTYCDINIKPVYVHGKAEMDKNNLVLGTHSFYNYLPNPINENISANFNIFKKHYQRHKYGTIEAYQDSFFAQLLSHQQNSRRGHPRISRHYHCFAVEMRARRCFCHWCRQEKIHDY